MLEEVHSLLPWFSDQGGVISMIQNCWMQIETEPPFLYFYNKQWDSHMIHCLGFSIAAVKLLIKLLRGLLTNYSKVCFQLKLLLLSYKQLSNSLD